LLLNFDPAIGFGSDPPSNSLFDIDNLATLVALGKNTTNILVDTT